MLKIIGVAAVLLATSTVSSADQGECDRILKQAEKEQAFFSPVEGYKVIGKGRLYFYSAPDKNCRTKDVFVIPNDDLIAYTEYKGWYSVMYVNPKTGDDYAGWVEPERLKSIGTMGPKN